MTKKVFVIWNHSLFVHTLKLLLNHPEIDWAGDTSDRDTANALIESCRPDTVLIEEVEGENLLDTVISSLEKKAHFFSVIGLNLSDNQLNWYQHKQMMVKRANDLVELILDPLTPK